MLMSNYLYGKFLSGQVIFNWKLYCLHLLYWCYRAIHYKLDHSSLTSINMIHSMHLDELPFDCISRWVKKIEFRVNDEKRQPVSVWDTIVFSLRWDDSKTIKVELIARHEDVSFYHLVERLDPDVYWYLQPDSLSMWAYLLTLNSYYDSASIQTYWVVGFEIKLV